MKIFSGFQSVSVFFTALLLNQGNDFVLTVTCLEFSFISDYSSSFVLYSKKMGKKSISVCSV